MNRGRSASSSEPSPAFSPTLRDDDEGFSTTALPFSGDAEEEKESANAHEAREQEQQLRRYLGHPRSSRLLTALEEVSLARREIRPLH